MERAVKAMKHLGLYEKGNGQVRGEPAHINLIFK